MEPHDVVGSILRKITNHHSCQRRIGQGPPQRSKAADLVFAVQRKDCAALENLVNNGADPNSALQSVTPLAYAVWEGLVDCVATLLRLGANPNLRAIDNAGRMEPPLMSAIRLGHPSSICVLLLENGADTNAKDFYGHTPLWAAVYSRRGDIIRLVLRHGAKVREWDRGKEVTPIWSECPLYQAILQGRQLWKFLVSAGASPRAVDGNGLAPLHHAVKRGDFEMVKHLVLGLGAPPVPPFGMERDAWLSDEVTTEIREWLLNEMQSPAPLIRICRLRIRLHLSECNDGRAVPLYIRRLPLPQQLIRYLLLDPLEP
ncbi:hypothetical protein J437_LFUL009598 [Ladona fulva]|uniref:SOCS box domain-containing protein n=1 Tax=Ladona fulva TaxID=123851 RepID=A0A8K0JV74_LADFU|nr:hypothetical protein J437_LFUL009598 [Ladona fulva]